jgi:hypothetical protein
LHQPFLSIDITYLIFFKEQNKNAIIIYIAALNITRPQIKLSNLHKSNRSRGKITALHFTVHVKG